MISRPWPSGALHISTSSATNTAELAMNPVTLTFKLAAFGRHRPPSRHQRRHTAETGAGQRRRVALAIELPERRRFEPALTRHKQNQWVRPKDQLTVVHRSGENSPRRTVASPFCRGLVFRWAQK